MNQAIKKIESIEYMVFSIQEVDSKCRLLGLLTSYYNFQLPTFLVILLHSRFKNTKIYFNSSLSS